MIGLLESFLSAYHVTAEAARPLPGAEIKESLFQSFQPPALSSSEGFHRIAPFKSFQTVSR
jgi:hypothetical protein